jgi:hypothetical protein
LAVMGNFSNGTGYFNETLRKKEKTTEPKKKE